MKVDNSHFRDIECNCWDAKQRISDIDSLGVNIQVLSTVPVMFNYDKKPMDCLYVSQ